MSTTPEHIVKAYDDDLQQLNTLVSRMGGIAESQLNASVDAVSRRDDALAHKVMSKDKEIDHLQHEIESMVVRLLALRQPMANDLRFTIAILKTASEIERIGDHAKNIAKRAIALNSIPQIAATRGVVQMTRLVQTELKDVLDAYLQGDVDKAKTVWQADQEVDSLYNSLFRELLTYMMEDPRQISACTHLLFIAKNLERIGDHATNIAETIHYQITGEELGDDRPKDDSSNYEVVVPDNHSGI